MKPITVRRAPQASVVLLMLMLVAHVALCHPAATSRGSPPIHPFWETIAPNLIYFAILLVSFFDDRAELRRLCRRVFVPAACLINAIVTDNLMGARPRAGAGVGMLGLLSRDFGVILFFAALRCALCYPLAWLLDDVAARFWNRYRDLADQPGTPFVRFSTTGLLAGVATLCVIFASLGWAHRAYTTWPRAELSHRCDLHLRHIGLAMQNYCAAYGAFPPAFVADNMGKPSHSWRVLLLPFLGQDEIYQAYRFDEPWNGPHNRLLAGRMPNIYRCAWNMDYRSADTSYVVVVGPGTIFPGAEATKTVPDGVSNTLLVVELADSGINWLEPRDLEFDKIGYELRPFSHVGHSPYAVHGVFADGHRFIADAMPAASLRALLTASGGEAVDGDW